MAEGDRRRIVRLARRQVPVARRVGGDHRAPRRRRRRPRARSSPTSGRRRARCSASCATTSAGRRCGRARTATCGSSTSRCSSAPTPETGRPKPGHHPFTQPHPDDRRAARERPDAGALAGLRPRAQRLGARLRLDPDPPQRPAAADLRGARLLRRGGRPQVRLLPQPVRVRRPAARRLRLRHRPPRRHPRRRGEHPRGDRLPEDAVRRRPDDELAVAGRPERNSTSSGSACCRPPNP